ncbi:MAG: aminotransferase class IV [Acidimicrobiia bacterium]
MISEILINGEVSDGQIPVTDSSVLRGDGCFEVLKSYKDVPFAVAEHLDRLERSASALQLTLPAHDLMAGWVGRVAVGLGDAVVRVVATRGSSVAGQPGDPMVIVFAHTWEGDQGPTRLYPVAAPWHSAGEAWDLMGAKILSYAPNLSTTRHAQNQGFDDAVLLARDGTVLEGPTFSVGWVIDGVLETPELGLGILDSITRAMVLEDARSVGIEVIEGRWTLDRVGEADEVMALSTTREVQPVAALGDMAFSEGPVTSRLARVFAQRFAS